MITFRAYGTPKPQGSKKIVHMGGKARMIDASKGLAEWRNNVIFFAVQARGDDFLPLEGPVQVHIMFYMPRPKKYQTKKWLFFQRIHHTIAPDIDKILRSTFDGITLAGIWKDDSQVAQVFAQKIYSDDAHTPGALITIDTLEDR